MAGLWCLHNSLNNQTIQGLSMEEVRAIATSLSTSEKTHWWAWKEYWEEWKPLIEIDEALHPLRRELSMDLPPLPQRMPTSTDIIPYPNAPINIEEVDISLGFEDDVIDLELIDNSVKIPVQREYRPRNFRRYKKRMIIRIMGREGQVFESHSVDVSVGGVCVEEKLPEWVAGYVQVKIIDPKKKQGIEVTCSVVEDQKPGEKYRLEILPLQKKEEEVNFDKWLAA